MSIKNLEIKPSEAKAVEIASLPTRPTSSATYGGRGLTAQEMKKAYDAYPALIKERFNALIADLLSGIAINDIPFSIPSHEPFGENIEQTVKGFLDAVGDILDFGTDNARTIFGFVKQFVNDVAKATSLEYDKNTKLLSLTIDGQEKSVKIDLDEFKNEITILKDRMELAETDIGTLQTDMSVANGEIADLKESKLDKTGGLISGNLDVAGSLFVNGENYDTTVSSLKDRIDFLSTLLFNTIITLTEVEDTYTSRVTAGGLPVVSNTPTTVHKIAGDTKASENLFPITPKASLTSLITANDNTWTFNGLTPSNNYTNFIDEIDITDAFEDGEKFTISQSQYYDSYKTAGAVYLNVQIRSGATIVKQYQCISSATTVTMDKSLGSYYLRVICGNNLTEMTQTISFMVDLGETALPYSDYYAGLKNASFKGVTSTGADGESDTSFQLSAARSLRKWDYIDIDNQRLVTGTAEVTKETAFTDEELATYPAGYILSSDRKTIAYPLETPTTAALTVPKTYTVWRNGSETVDTGATDALTPTITQTYYEEVTA